MKQRMKTIIISVIISILLIANGWQIYRYNKLTRGFRVLYNTNLSYYNYIKKSFNSSGVDVIKIAPQIKNYSTEYNKDNRMFYVAYISSSVCTNCLISLYVDLRDIGIDSSDILFVSQSTNIQLAREAKSYGFENFISGQELWTGLEQLRTTDVVFFKYNPSTLQLNYILYDDTSKPILNILLDC